MSVIRGLVSTLIPVFNRETMLLDAVDSVLAQTYRPIEIVIVDDGSTDGTSAAVDRLAAREPDVIRVIHQTNGGPGVAREAGRRTARGEFIQHLDSDDLLLPRKFELQVEALRANGDCGAAYGWTRFRAEDGTVVPEPWKRSGEEIPAMFPAMLRSRWWDTPTPLYRATVLHGAGPWLPLRIEEDWEYDARIAAAGVRLAHVAEWVCEVRRHGSEHASGHGLDRRLLHDRATAHAAIYHHARRAGIADDAPEMRHFARELFLLARQCGAAGLSDDSRSLLRLAREATGRARRQLDLAAYELLAATIGWRNAGRLAGFLDAVRR